jgi:hypothetical protein
MKITIEKDRNHYEVSVHVGNVEIYGSFEDDEFVPLWFSSEDAEKYYEKTHGHYEVSVHVENGEIWGSFKDDEFVPSWFSNKDAEKYYEKNWALIDEQVNNLIYEVY